VPQSARALTLCQEAGVPTIKELPHSIQLVSRQALALLQMHGEGQSDHRDASDDAIDDEHAQAVRLQIADQP